MPAEFEITTTDQTVLKLEPGDIGTFSFQVRGLTGPSKNHEIMLQARIVGPDGKDAQADWLVPGPQPVILIAGDDTVNVTITARPDSKLAGTHTIKLVVIDKASPQQRVDSPTVTCKVFGPQLPPPQKLRWWVALIVVLGTFSAGVFVGAQPAAGIILLLIGGALFGLGVLVWRLVKRLQKS